MKLHYSHGMTSGRIARIVGTFVLLPIVAMLVIGIFMAKTEGLFQPRFRLHAVLNDSFGLAPGTRVLMAGLPIGRVERIRLNDAGSIEVTLELLEAYHSKVRDDSLAIIKKSGFVGASEVLITVGTPPARILPDGGTIQVEQPQELADLLKDLPALAETIKRTLAEVEAITKDVRGAAQTGGRVLANVEEASKELPATLASVERSLAAVEKATATLPELTASAKRTLGTVDQAVHDVRRTTERLPAVIERVQESLNNVKAITDSLKTTSKQLRPVLRSAHAALDDTNLILRGAKNTWPVSAFVHNAGPEPPPTDPSPGSLRGDQLAP
jgi:phospholipid/cholesterol/gamma-HCH transport system substrate-binding protein